MIKFVNLVLYNDDNENYVRMYHILTEHYQKYPNVTTFFYKYNNNLTNEIELNGNIINIKGEESYIPGILEKTLIAFEFIQTHVTDFDYIVRSNISSIIDFKLLSLELGKNEIEYYGGTRFGKIPFKRELEISYVNTPYASGTNIILSKKGLQLLIENKHLINNKVVDDVSIGALFKDLKIKHKEIIPNKFVFVPYLRNNKRLFEKIMGNNYVLYRNNNGKRVIDVVQMNMITNALKNKS
jgi:hypothetical protein